jgi:hypothetical protein
VRFADLNTPERLVMTKIETNSYNTCSFDSFYYRIPLDDVDVIDTGILEKQVEVRYVVETGEITNYRPIQANSLHPERDGYKIHFQIQKMPDCEYLVVLINSKLLEYQYLNGITMNNIELVYNNLMKCNVFYCTFEQFLTWGKVTDIDIKKDIELTKEDFLKGIKELQTASIPRTKVSEGVRSFNTRNNMGIQWNDRTTASSSKPFVKIYYKEIESSLSDTKQLSKNEAPFFDTYVNYEELVNRVRIEVTIKNLKSARIHGINDLTLLNILKLTPEQLNEIIIKNLNLNLHKRMPKAIKARTDISPADMLAYIHLSNMIKNQSYSFELALEYTLQHFADKQQKHRQKVKLTDIYSKYIQGEKYELKVKRLNTFYNQIGWG